VGRGEEPEALRPLSGCLEKRGQSSLQAATLVLGRRVKKVLRSVKSWRSKEFGA
jgi:hypothetical protein